MGHCLKHCEKWLVGRPDEKTVILIKGGGCLRCTAPWYETGSNKCKVEGKECGIGGCNKTHNQELHLVKDQRVYQVNMAKYSIMDSSWKGPQ